MPRGRGRVTDAELAQAKKLWRSGLNDIQVGKVMGWCTTKAFYIRTIVLKLPPNRTWALQKRGKR